MSLSLYYVTNEYVEALDNLMHMRDDIPDECFDDTLESIVDDFNSKAINVAGYIKNISEEITAMKAYELNMRIRRQAAEAHAERLKDYLLVNMKKAGVQKIPGSEFNVSVRKCQDSVNIADPDAIPECYLSKKVTFSADKAKIKSAIVDGKEVPGAFLNKENKTIVIK